MASSKRIRFIQLLAPFTTQAALEGIGFIIWTFYRSPAEQNYLYQQGRTRPGKIITNCDGFIKLSNHQKWLAVDILIIKDDGTQVWERTPEYDRLGKIWEALGGTWGGNFTSPAGDIFHFELADA
jgi:peptidoglycan L-alanyl-D-glutamate endopeptidase CwlK